MLIYIDPGTGSMLFTILIGVLGAAIYAFKGLWLKLKFMIKGGNIKVNESDRVPFVIFTDSKRYYTIFKPICDEMEKRGQTLLYLTGEKDDPLLDENYEYVQTEFAGEGNRPYARMNLLKADIVLSSTPGLDVYQWKRSRDVRFYVHVLHAATYAMRYRMFGLDYYDALLLSSDYQAKFVRDLEELRNRPEKEIIMAGLPHLDALQMRLQQSHREKTNKKTVLVAPTWGPSGLFTRFGDSIIKKLLETDYDIIIRPHPQSFVSEKEMIDKLMAEFPENDRVHWDRSTDNFNALNSSDILVSDFSGVIFDYILVFEKPVIYSQSIFDNGIYDTWWLNDNEELTFNAFNRAGMALNEDNFDKIDEMIAECLQDESIRVQIAQIRQEIWKNDGNSIKTIVDYMIEKRDKLLSAEKQSEQIDGEIGNVNI